MTTTITGNSVNTANIKDAAGTFNKQNVVQVVNVTDGAVATGTTPMPHDDTIPQNTEGDQYMSLAVTPKDATNILLIQIILNMSHSTSADDGVLALFQDSTADALAAVAGFIDNSARSYQLVLNHYMVAGSASEITFKARAGHPAAGTTTFNGVSGSRIFGGVLASSINITEYQPV